MEAVKKDADFALSHFSGRGAILRQDYYITLSYTRTPLVRGVYPVVQSLIERADVVSKNRQIRHLLETSFAILFEEFKLDNWWISITSKGRSGTKISRSSTSMDNNSWCCRMATVEENCIQ